jgi:hypothetical protein
MKVHGWIVVVLAAGCGGAGGAVRTGGAAAAPSERADIAPVRSELSVYTDGKGHLVALVEPNPESPAPDDLTLFYGDGKTFHAVPLYSSSDNGLAFEVGFKDARVPSLPAGSIKREQGKTTLSCWGEEVELTKLPAAEAQAMVGGAAFMKNRTRWAPLALSKEGDRYLYVDSGQIPENYKKYRVWRGAKGKMREVPLTDSSYDERANEFTFKTKDGVLKARRAEEVKTEYTLALQWDGKKEELKPMPRSENWKLIFDELGVYDGRSPTPCDPLLK